MEYKLIRLEGSVGETRTDIQKFVNQINKEIENGMQPSGQVIVLQKNQKIGYFQSLIKPFKVHTILEYDLIAVDSTEYMTNSDAISHLNDVINEKIREDGWTLFETTLVVKTDSGFTCYQALIRCK